MTINTTYGQLTKEESGRTRILAVGVGLIAVLFVATLFFLQPVQVAHGSVYTAANLSTATTSTAIAVTSSQRILATTTNALGNGTSYTRVYASICNPSATLVYLNINGDKPTNVPAGNYTTVIAAAAGYSACYEITDRNLYQGSITASSTNQTSVNVQVSDYVQ